MKLGYCKFSSHTEAEEFITNSFKKTGESIPDWFKQDGLKIYGYFFDEDNPSNRGKQFFLFGRTIQRSAFENDGVGIFSRLKQYGSSNRYKGLISIFGKEIISNNYECFTPFISLECDGFTLLIAEKYGKKGLISICNSFFDGKILTPVIYDDFFYANEYTLGFVKDDKVGFMNMNGVEVIKAEFIIKDGYNLFQNCKALVKLNSNNSVPVYINHYGDIIEYYEDEVVDYFPTFGNGTGYYPYGDLPSSLDAYEGDPSNYWNND